MAVRKRAYADQKPAPVLDALPRSGWHFSVIVYWRIFSHCVLHTILPGKGPKRCVSSSSTGLGGDRVCLRAKPAAVGRGALASSAIVVQRPLLSSLGLTLPEIGSQDLLDFRDFDIKFSLSRLMEILRDHEHEGWVLAAYPDPNTHRPLIGAGFSLDVQAAPHPQRDPLNPHPFVEPSSAQLWQAAGLPPERLQQILDQFDRDSNAWTARQYRRKVIRHKLTPQLTEEEGSGLLRISAIQAVYNAKAYCRDFDQLTGPQQMAL